MFNHTVSIVFSCLNLYILKCDYTKTFRDTVNVFGWFKPALDSLWLLASSILICSTHRGNRCYWAQLSSNSPNASFVALISATRSVGGQLAVCICSGTKYWFFAGAISGTCIEWHSFCIHSTMNSLWAGSEFDYG